MRATALFFPALLLLLAPLPSRAERRGVPKIDAPEEEADPEFRKAPAGQDLQSLIKHLGACIASSSPQGEVPGIDLFIANLEAQLCKGNDAPRDKILRNAVAARDALRLAYNALAEADSPPKIPRAGALIKETAAGLHSALKRNRDSLNRLKEVADTARATVEAMTLDPPSSPGSLVPIDLLSGVTPLEGEIRPLQGKLRQAEAAIRDAKSLVDRAKQGQVQVESFAEQAASLDKDAVQHVTERRTRGTPDAGHEAIQSREVIMNADQWLKSSVASAEELLRLLEREAARKMVERTLEADTKTQNAKVRASQSGERINYNHTMRLNDVIPAGWEIAAAPRKPWWVNRARMAKTEATTDSGKIDEAYQDAEASAQKAEKSVEASMEAVEKIDALLGRPGDRLPQLSKRDPLDVPAPKNTPGRSAPGGVQTLSKPVKIPHTLDVSDQEITESYDSKTPNGR